MNGPGGPQTAGSEPSVETVAGDGMPGCSGDGHPAAEARLYSPSGVAVDRAGNVYIADGFNNRVRKVDATTRTISTIVGIADTESTGSVRLHSPHDVAVGTAGDVYIADTGNNRVLRASPDGTTITTIAGDRKEDCVGGNDKATEVHLNQPRGVAVGTAGDVYIADTGNSRVLRASPDGTTITTIAGTGSAGFSGDTESAVRAQLNLPEGVAVDATGDVYIADAYNDRVRRVDAATQTIDTVAGGGTEDGVGGRGSATKVRLNHPQGVAVDATGDVYIADTYNHMVRVVVDVRFSLVRGSTYSLTRGGKVGYLGLHVRAEEDSVVPVQKVVAVLPAQVGVQFVREGSSYGLSVEDHQGVRRDCHDGVLSLDGQSLTFEKVQLALSQKGQETALWIAVRAPATAQLKQTCLDFQVGSQHTCAPLEVVP